MNAVNFTLPEVAGGSRWRCLIDTNDPEPDGTKTFKSGNRYRVTGRSVVFLALQPDRAHSIALRRAREAFRHMAEQPIPVMLPDTEGDEDAE